MSTDSIRGNTFNGISKITVNVDRLKSLLAQNRYQEVFNDRELFWQAYCISTQSSLAFDSKFNVTLSGDRLIVRSYREKNAGNKKIIEVVRELFQKNFLNKKDFSICTYDRRLFVKYYLFNGDISQLDVDEHTSVSRDYFNSFIKPCLNSLAELFNATCIEKEKTKTVSIKGHLVKVSTSEPLEEYHIEWDKQHHYIYPINPKVIPKNEMEYNGGYQLYLNQKFCDFSIAVGPNKETQHMIKLHFLPLFANGGKFIQKMFDHETKETAENTIHFPEHSLDVIKAYINFVYLGEGGITPEYIATNNVNPVELLDFAHTYQIERLIDCCTNLICLNSDENDGNFSKSHGMTRIHFASSMSG